MDLSFNIYYFLRDTLLMMLAWFLMASSFHSWGNFLSKKIGIIVKGQKGIFVKIWLGFVACIVFFSIYQLFLPINAFASSLFYISGIICFFIKNGSKLPNFFKSIGWQKILIILLTLFLASAVSIQVPTNVDSGFYHFNSIRWLNEYHIIKGLGNLHSKLGFNQLFFIFCASINFHPYLNDYAFHAANSFIYALFFITLVFNGTLIDSLFLGLFFFIPMPYSWLSSPTPDIASTLIQIVAFRFFLEAVYFKPQNQERSAYISLVAILSAILITIKLSNIVFTIGLGLTTIFFSYKYKMSKQENKQIGKTFIFIGLVFFIWIIRGYIQTGYPLFPSTIGKINTSWTVPEIIARIERNRVYAGSRSCERTFNIDSPLIQNYAWVPYWIKRYFFDTDIHWSGETIDKIIIIPYLLFFPSTINNWGIGSITLCIVSLALFLVWLICLMREKALFHKSNILFLLLIMQIGSLIFWFFTAPCPRFANGTFIIIFIINLLLLKEAKPKLIVSKGIKKALLLYSLLMFIWNFNISYSYNEFYINGIQVLKKYPMKEHITQTGLKILIPEKGAIFIGDSDLPATPNKFDSLSLLSDNIEDGFCIKGEKQ